MPRYGYGGIKRSGSTGGGGAASRTTRRAVVKLSAGERAPLRPKKLPL
jgi:hypothetical protein